jgi:hypothetical protein
LTAALSVSVAGLAAAYNAVQAVPPEPPAAHPFNAFANELIFVSSAVPVAGNPIPGTSPVVAFTRLANVAAPKPIPLLLVAVAPRLSPSKNCAIE